MVGVLGYLQILSVSLIDKQPSISRPQHTKGSHCGDKPLTQYYKELNSENIHIRGSPSLGSALTVIVLVILFLSIFHLHRHEILVRLLFKQFVLVSSESR